MGISCSTYYAWQRQFPQISQAIKKGKAPVDAQVENALLKRALGYSYTETITDFELSDELDEDGNPKKKIKNVRMIKKEVAPDVGAAAFWLKNRRPDRWRDKREEQVQVTGADYSLLDGAMASLKRRGYGENGEGGETAGEASQRDSE